MSVHGSEIEWLMNPELIPREIVSDPEYSSNPFVRTSAWMVESIAQWAEKTHGDLSYQEVFEKYDLPNGARVQVRSGLSAQAFQMYSPGFLAMAEIFGAIPDLAMQQGKNDPAQWLQLADSSRAFGAAIAKDGTRLQATIRGVLGLRPAMASQPGLPNLVLDEATGLTTRLPLQDIITGITKLLNEVDPASNTRRTCTALQAKIPELGGKSMFDAAWDSYLKFAERVLYTLPVEKVTDFRCAPFNDMDEVMTFARTHVKHDYEPREHELSTARSLQDLINLVFSELEL